MLTHRKLLQSKAIAIENDAMLGDAAHPMTPFLGQGACVAIEDAMVLERAFAAANTFEEAFCIYENTRKERANGVQLASREQANEIQGRDGKGTKSWSNRR
jgi:2-polyprenyl-6-methoxyphenol hydroxylase-like FAD-dependent oxidoreductase